MKPLGQRTWVIPEGWLPDGTAGAGGRALTSHEAACILNTGDREARITITIFYEDREPGGPYHLTIAPRRTLHLRFDDLRDPEPVPRSTAYSSVIESSEPVVVQHTRLDARQAETALLSTIAHPAG